MIFDTIFLFLAKNISVATVRRSALPSLSVDASTCLSFFFEKNPAIQRLASFYDAKDAEYVLSLAGDTESLSIEVEVGESAS